MTLLEINWGLWIPIAMMFLLIFGAGGYSAAGAKPKDQGSRDEPGPVDDHPGAGSDDPR